MPDVVATSSTKIVVILLAREGDRLRDQPRLRLPRRARLPGDLPRHRARDAVRGLVRHLPHAGGRGRHRGGHGRGDPAADHSGAVCVAARRDRGPRRRSRGGSRRGRRLAHHRCARPAGTRRARARGPSAEHRLAVRRLFARDGTRPQNPPI